MAATLRDFPMLGIKTGIEFLHDTVLHPEFLAGRTYTDFIPKNMPDWAPHTEMKTLAEALTAAVLQVESVGRRGHMGAAVAGIPSPWETIGGWEMGKSQ
jgi:acetyl/propionyl-CoA carboxylase alpha subunit